MMVSLRATGGPQPRPKAQDIKTSIETAERPKELPPAALPPTEFLTNIPWENVTINRCGRHFFTFGERLRQWCYAFAGSLMLEFSPYILRRAAA